MHTQARGGAAAIDAIVAEAADIQIVENGSVVDGRYLCSKAPAFRIDIFDGGKHVFCEGLDSSGPWIWREKKSAPEQGVPDARRTGIQGIEFNLYGLHAFPRLGNRLSFEGRERIENVDYYVIGIEMQGSYQTFLYIDPESWLIARRRDFRAPHPDIDATKKFIENQYSDYRPVAGVQTAYLSHQVNLATDQITQVTIVKSIKYNPILDAKMLSRSYKA
jgi:hypothetical protein